MDRLSNKGKKRKSTDDAVDRCYGYHTAPPIVPSRFISRSKTMKASSSPGYHQRSNETATFSLPQEVFCKVVSFLGPTSTSLCCLSQVSREYRQIMALIGETMVKRARLRFVTPLPPLSQLESSLSLFVRSARVSKFVHDKLEEVDQVLSEISKLPLHHNGSVLCPLPLMSSSDSGLPKLQDVHHALNIALCLLGYWKQDFFQDPTLAQRIAKSANTTALKWRATSICSKLGATVYKFVKSRMCARHEREHELSLTDATDETDDEVDYEDDYLAEEAELEADFDVVLLEKACLVMQYTVLRNKHFQKPGIFISHTKPSLQNGPLFHLCAQNV